MLSFETSESAGVLIVAFEDKEESGDNRQATLRQTLYLTIESQSDPRFAFDLSGVRYLTSSDIGFLITLRRRIAARKGTVILFSVDPYLLDILRTMKLLSLFEFASDQREALTRLAARGAT